MKRGDKNSVRKMSCSIFGHFLYSILDTNESHVQGVPYLSVQVLFLKSIFFRHNSKENFLGIFKMKHPVKDVQMLVLRVFRYFLFKKQVKKVLKYPKENSPSIVLIFLSIFSGETIECEQPRKHFYTTTQ